MASRVATKSFKWFNDPATYPLIAFMGVGALMCVAFGMRQLTKSPDVKWNKEVRRSHEIAAAKEQTQWMAHRKVIKNLSENAVNTNRSQ